jgi:hypothetical protein
MSDFPFRKFVISLIIFDADDELTKDETLV